MAHFTAEERIFCCRFFSEFFRTTPTKALEPHWQVLADLFGLDPEPAPHFDDDLAKAWARTFYGVGTNTVMLTQSAWESALQLNCQQPCLDAKATYAQAGVSPQTGDDALPEDHISVLMGFCAWLITEEHAQRPTPVKLTDFAQAHLNAWCTVMAQAAADSLNHEGATRVLECFTKFVSSKSLMGPEA